jgi:hypothetical protein
LHGWVLLRRVRWTFSCIAWRRNPPSSHCTAQTPLKLNTPRSDRYDPRNLTLNCTSWTFLEGNATLPCPNRNTSATPPSPPSDGYSRSQPVAIRAEQRIRSIRWRCVARRDVRRRDGRTSLRVVRPGSHALAHARLARAARKVDFELAVGDVVAVDWAGAALCAAMRDELVDGSLDTFGRHGAGEVARVGAHAVFVVGGAFGFGGAAEAGDLLEG